MWFIGVEVEQETSAPPPKKKTWIRPCCAPTLRNWKRLVIENGRRKGLLCYLICPNRALMMQAAGIQFSEYCKNFPLISLVF